MLVTQLYLDLDGVFADFNRGVHAICGMQPSEIPKNRMWAIVHSNKRFFAELEFMPDAVKLWHGVKDYSPIFLTGAPSSHAFREQKKEWVGDKFGLEHVVIVLPRKEKQLYSGPGKVLIDDTLEMIEQWEAKGGIGIYYQGDVDHVLEMLDEAKSTGYVIK